jgi:hypothetical protein
MIGCKFSTFVSVLVPCYLQYAKNVCLFEVFFCQVARDGSLIDRKLHVDLECVSKVQCFQLAFFSSICLQKSYAYVESLTVAWGSLIWGASK